MGESKTLCKFRISAHQLEIDRGRYFNVEVKNRICKLCNSDVEDEIHFLLKWSALLKIRNPILNSLQSNYKNFSRLDTESSFIWLMSSEDPFVFNSVYKLLQCLNEERNALLLNAGGCGSGWPRYRGHQIWRHTGYFSYFFLMCMCIHSFNTFCLYYPSKFA